MVDGCTRIYYNMGNLLIARNAEVVGSNPTSVILNKK